MTWNKNKIAIFFDCENLSVNYLDKVYDEVKSYGEVIIGKGYSNWNDNRNKKWRDRLSDYAIEQIQPNTSDKNSSDIKITIDVMKTICDKKVQTIVLVSSDSDFTSLAIEVKSQGYQVIGLGEKKSPKSLRNAYTSFIELYHEDENLKDETKLIDLLNQAIENKKDNQGYALISDIGDYLKKQFSLSAKKYGFDRWGDVFKKYTDNFVIDYKDEGKSMIMVKVKG